MLTGTVETPLDAKRAADLANIFVTRRRSDDRPVFADRRRRRRGGGVDIDNPDQERRVSQIVNLLKIIGDDQVTLKVTVAEVSRTVMKQLGVNMIGSRQHRTASAGARSATTSPASASRSRSSQLGARHARCIDAYLNAMEQSGVMKTLAEPTLTAVSGEKATFRVGGEFNLVTGQDVDAETTARSPTTSRRSNTASGWNSSRSCCRRAASA